MEIDSHNDGQHAIAVEGVHFDTGVRGSICGDFRVMICQREFRDAIFVFNGNVRDDLTVPYIVGGGSAVIRPHQQDLRACGVPTGWAPGHAFKTLDDMAKMAIDDAFARLAAMVRARAKMLNAKRGDNSSPVRIIYPSSKDGKTIGVHIFAHSIGQDVVQYISHRLTTFDVDSEKVVPLDFFNSRLAFYREKIRQACKPTLSIQVPTIDMLPVVTTQKPPDALHRRQTLFREWTMTHRLPPKSGRPVNRAAIRKPMWAE